MDDLMILRFRHREELHQWLSAHHESEPYCRVICRRGKPPEDGTLWYIDVVEEALCFGWIDSTLLRLPTGENAQKLMPRSKKSHWTELNKARCRRMERLGLMTDAGRVVMPDMDEPFRIRGDILSALQSDAVAWRNFRSFPDLYQRIRIDNIQGYSRSKAEQEKLISKLIRTSRDGVMYGQWNDYGRLIEEEE